MTQKTSVSPVFIAQIVVDWPQQEEFLRFSGDRNPMHADALAARRTPPGQVVVYGMHMLLWVLDSLAAQGQLGAGLSRLRLDFRNWIYLGDTVTLWFTKGSGGRPDRCHVRVEGLLVLLIDLYSVAAEAGPSPRFVLAAETKRTEARDLSLEKVEGCQGAFAAADAQKSAALFPALASTFGTRLAAEIATCSYIVGMEAPGLYSIDSSADLNLHPVSTPDERWPLSYTVQAVDPRFRRASLRVKGQAISGVLSAFVRNPPVRQASMAEAAEHVRPREFEGMRALIVGGSRGLGEAAAKCIATGGGRCTLTYSVGEEEAASVTRQIRETGGEASMARYDVRQPAGPQLATIPGPFTHVLYFATCPMFRPKSALVSASRLAEFTQFYLQGFHDLCVELVRPESGLVAAGGPLVVYYPSSELLNDRGAGATEFAAIKAAGELMCRDLESYLPGLRVVTARLPRLLTDQTTSLVPERLAHVLEVLLPSLRQLSGGSDQVPPASLMG